MNNLYETLDALRIIREARLKNEMLTCIVTETTTSLKILRSIIDKFENEIKNHLLGKDK